MWGRLHPEDNIKISKHAYKRAKQRLSWKRKATHRMAHQALTIGRSLDELCSSEKELICHKMSQQSEGAKIMVHPNVIFIFRENELVTLYPKMWRVPELSKKKEREV